MRQTPLHPAHRRGSILIITVVLLVLLAIIGTAYITTSGTDRVTARQHVANTQIEMLVDGVRAMLTDAITADRTGAANNFPGNGSTPIDSSLLASRHPWLIDPTQPASPANRPVWDAITLPLTPGSTVAFENPITGTPVNFARSLQRQFLFAPGEDNNGNLTLTAITRATGQPAGTPTYAADADGDGIADSFLWRMPVSEIDGVTWYAAVRVVDNNSAVNINTAHVFENETLPGAFPSHLPLTDVLSTPEANTVLQVRTNNAGATVHNRPVEDPTPHNGFSITERNAIVFNSPGEATWLQSGRRLENPGYNRTSERYRTFSLGDQMALAYRFVLRNPAATPGTVEQAAASLTSNAVRLSPYLGSASVAWFNEQFDFDLANTRPARSMLVSFNGVNNIIAPLGGALRPEMPAWYGQNDAWRGRWEARRGYSANNLVDYGGITYRATTSIAAPGNNQPDNLPPIQDGGRWMYFPWKPAPTRTPINTAGFNELYRAFWMVLASDANPQQPAHPIAPATDPKMFRSIIRDPRAPTVATDPSFTRLSPDMMMYLRSAIAAANAMELRDADEDITPRTITLSLTEGGANNIPITVTIYGTEKQPYITEVYANTDTNTVLGTGANPAGYVAVELHNPYPFEIDIAGCILATVDRNDTAIPAGQPMNLTKTLIAQLNAMTSNAGGGSLSPSIIPANGTLLLENYDANNTGTQPGRALHRPTSTGLPPTGPIDTSLDPAPGYRNFAYVPELSAALGKELILMRPLTSTVNRIDRNTITRIQFPPTTGTPLPRNYAPLDAFDFTGISIANQRVAHYQRMSGQGANNWKFVYPGRYISSNDASAATPRYTLDYTGGSGINGGEWAVGDPEPPLITAPTLTGGDNPSSTYSNPFPPVQVANYYFGGFNPPSGAPYNYPFGGFPRLGDAAQITYVGHYKLQRSNQVNSDNVVEINPITFDIALADDNEPLTDPLEHLGRFVPVLPPVGTLDPYDFAHKLFSYITVHELQDDYTVPNHTPVSWFNATSETTLLGAVPTRAPRIDGTPNRDDVTAGVHGLVNINTAPWRVLAALPLVIDPATGAVNRQESFNLAKAIVFFRDRDRGDGQPYGPFNSIYDLLRVPGFADPSGVNAVDDPAALHRVALGDFTPFAGDDFTLNDYESRYNQVIRLSSMLTTRSDTFTAYVLLQGWRNPGTPSATLIAERRVGYIFDRTQLTPTNKEIRSTRFEQN